MGSLEWNKGLYPRQSNPASATQTWAGLYPRHFSPNSAMFLIPGTWPFRTRQLEERAPFSYVLGTWYLELGTSERGSSKSTPRSAWPLVLLTRAARRARPNTAMFLELGTWYLVLLTRQLEERAPFSHALDTWNLVLGTSERGSSKSTPRSAWNLELLNEAARRARPVQLGPWNF